MGIRLIPKFTSKQQKKGAKEFCADWDAKLKQWRKSKPNAANERAHCQPFWMDLLRYVYGVDKPSQVVDFEFNSLMDHGAYVDALTNETHVLIEQKALGKDLGAPITQSSGALSHLSSRQRSTARTCPTRSGRAG